MLRMTISPKLRRALFDHRANGGRQYLLAHRLGLHPSLLSHLVSGAVAVRENDERILRLAAFLGVHADEAFITLEELMDREAQHSTARAIRRGHEQ